MTSDFDRLIDEASRFPISGWDFSPIQGRWRARRPPWNFVDILRVRLQGSSTLLDLGTGGGELLESLAPLPRTVFATEGHPPNFDVATRRLRPLGVRVLKVGPDQHLSLPSESVDTVSCRHEAFSAPEVHRVLVPNGQFITQQVGGLNHREFREHFGIEPAPSYNDVSSDVALSDEIGRAGLHVTDCREAVYSEEFLDVGALVYFLRVAPWEVPGFSLTEHRDALREIHDEIRFDQAFRVTAHRLLVVASRPG